MCAIICAHASAQELYIQTEPASNMPKGSMGIRLTDRVFKQNGYVNTWLVPELMAGISKNFMFHSGLYTSDHPHNDLAINGGYLYAKYRFYSYDELQKHLRLSIFGRLAKANLYNANDSKTSPNGLFTAELDGYFSGYELGAIATTLLHKLAISVSGTYSKIGDYKTSWNPYRGNGFQYAISAGYLLLPRHYKSYDQINVNLYAELLGFYNTNIDANNTIQVIPENNFMEIAPGVQFIINSQTRIDIGYRMRVQSKIAAQQSNQMILLRLEHTIFNLW